MTKDERRGRRGMHRAARAGSTRASAPPPEFAAEAEAAAGAAAPARRGAWWTLLHSWWVIPSLMGGFFTWAGFLYIGLRDRSRRWVCWGVAYLVLSAALCLFIANIPDAASQLNGQAAAGVLGLWLGGMLHSFYTNLRRLALLSAAQPRAGAVRPGGGPAREVARGGSAPATLTGRGAAARRPSHARERAGRQSGLG